MFLIALLFGQLSGSRGIPRTYLDSSLAAYLTPSAWAPRVYHGLLALEIECLRKLACMPCSGSAQRCYRGIGNDEQNEQRGVGDILSYNATYHTLRDRNEGNSAPIAHQQ